MLVWLSPEWVLVSWSALCLRRFWKSCLGPLPLRDPEPWPHGDLASLGTCNLGFISYLPPYSLCLLG